MTDFPRCATCRVQVQPGQNVVFRLDGRVAHAECPEVLCPVCTRRILPGDPIRRNGEEMLHGNCWIKRHRALAGGANASP
jgi:ferredoxin